MALAAPAGAETTKVLAIHFAPDLEVNPVTQNWVNHQLGRAKGDGYKAAVINYGFLANAVMTTDDAVSAMR